MTHNNLECIICYDEKKGDIITLRDVYYTNCVCNSTYHQRCLYKWFDKNFEKCPVCKSYIEIDYFKWMWDNFPQKYKEIVSIPIIIGILCVEFFL
jgi:hypothetical protein